MSPNENRRPAKPSESKPIGNGATHTTEEIVERVSEGVSCLRRQVHTEPDLVFDEIVESASAFYAS